MKSQNAMTVISTIIKAHLWNANRGQESDFIYLNNLIDSYLLETDPRMKLSSHGRRTCWINTVIYLVFDMAHGPGICIGGA